MIIIEKEFKGGLSHGMEVVNQLVRGVFKTSPNHGRWNENIYYFKGLNAIGKIVVGDSTIHVEVKLPQCGQKNCDDIEATIQTGLDKIIENTL
jgi:hypothetical protein